MNRAVSDITQIVYKKILKPTFFLFSADSVHDANVRFGKMLGSVPIARKSIAWMWSFQDQKLAKTLDGIVFPNPVGLSAGFDYDGDLVEILPALGFGFHTIGTVTLQSYIGNVKPQLGRLPRSQALLVNKGLKNSGAKTIIRKLKKYDFKIPVGISIASTNTSFSSDKKQIEDIIQCFQLFEKSSLKHAYYELNISCPNTFGGEPFTSPERLEMLMKKMDTLHLKRPLYIKMPIDQSEKETLLLLNVLSKHRVQGVIFGNLTKDKKNPAVDAEDRKIWLGKKGNLSGKPTWVRSNKLIALTRKKFKKRFTIIGTGGIFSGQDAAKKVKLGADLVQLITGMIFEGPQVIGQINHDLTKSVISSS